MARRNQATFAKRQRETAKRQKQREKDEKRALRRTQRASGESDSDTTPVVDAAPVASPVE
jgi:hypothetical protein